MKNRGITLKEYNFLRAYIDMDSNTFGNAYRSGLKAGYSKAYCRVIKRHYSWWRMKWLKMTLKSGNLARAIEVIRNADLGPPMLNKRQTRDLERENARRLNTPSLKNIIRELEDLF